MPAPIFQLTNVKKRFGDITALSDISFDLQAGERLAVIGPTVAGKSVLLKCLLGLYDTDAGVIDYGGSRPKIGMLFQHNALFDSLSVWENVAFELLQTGTKRKQARAQADSLLEKVGLRDGAAELPPSQLSGGMQKRVGFARAIANNADLLLLDNPTAGLDPILSRRIETMIMTLSKERNASVVAVTADMTAVCDTYDKLAVLDKGVLRWFGTTKEARTTKDEWVRQLLDNRRDGPMAVQLH